MPSATPALATSTPMAPRPMTPSVFPAISGPTNCFLPASTCFSMEVSPSSRPLHHSMPSAILREASSSAASTSSFTALAFAPGELNTTTPFSAISSSGMLFTPAPARATQSSFPPTSMPCMSALRTSMASGSSTSALTLYSPSGRMP